LIPEHTPSQLAKCRTGIRGLDEITNGGLPKGRPSLVYGNAGSGKTIVGMEFLLHGALEYGEPGVFISFEETEEELAQNVASLGFDLDELVSRSLISLDYVHFDRSEAGISGTYDLDGLFVRLGHAIDTSIHGSACATWNTRVNETAGLHILKSRGMAHSNQIREFRISDRGVDLMDVYLGSDGVLAGTARLSQESLEKSNALARQQELQRRKREHERKRDALEANIGALRAESENIDEALKIVGEEERLYQQALLTGRADMAHIRKADIAHGTEEVSQDIPA